MLNNSPDDLIPERTPVTGIESLSRAEEVAYLLYREAAVLVTVIACAYYGLPDAEYPLDRDQAINSGLLSRLAALMRQVAKFAADRENGELILILNRCIFETITNLEFLISHAGSDMYDEYVERSLGPERELFDLIAENIAARGGEKLPIEERMLSSVQKVCAASGKRIEEISAKQKHFGGNFRARLEAIGKGDLYLTFNRIGSHAVHGTWVDVSRNYLMQDEESGRYKLRRTREPDARLLTPAAYLALDGVLVYTKSIFQSESVRCLIEAVENLMLRIRQFEGIHEHLFQTG